VRFVDIRIAQRLAWENKLAKGFDTADVPLEFCLLNGEVAEAFDAWRKGRPDVADELADIALYLLGLPRRSASTCRTRSKPRWPRTSCGPTADSPPARWSRKQILHPLRAPRQRPLLSRRPDHDGPPAVRARPADLLQQRQRHRLWAPSPGQPCDPPADALRPQPVLSNFQHHYGIGPDENAAHAANPDKSHLRPDGGPPGPP
jgi:hypothetical protein